MIPKADPPITPSAPTAKAPANSCDSHFHMVAGPAEYPLGKDRIEDPAEGSHQLWMERLRQQMTTLGTSRGVIVQSIFYESDNSIVMDTIRMLGSEAFRGIAIVTESVSDAELDQMREAGIVGVRVNYVHGGLLNWAGAKALAHRLRERGMHIQMLINAREHIAELADDLRTIPVPVVFDHMGWPNLQDGVDEPGFSLMAQLLEEGHIWVKLSGGFRFCEAPYTEVDAHLAKLAAANQDQCLWGSDWPYLMLAQAKTPDTGLLLDALFRAIPDADTRHKILVNNPAALYKF